MSSVSLMPVSTFSATLLTADSWTQTEMIDSARELSAWQASCGGAVGAASCAAATVWPSIAKAHGCVKNLSDCGKARRSSSGASDLGLEALVGVRDGRIGLDIDPRGEAALRVLSGNGFGFALLLARAPPGDVLNQAAALDGNDVVDRRAGPGAGHGGKNVNARRINPEPLPGGECRLTCRIDANRPVAADAVAAVHRVQHGVEGGELRGRVRIGVQRGAGLAHRAARAVNDRAQNHIIDRRHVVHRPADSQIEHLFADASAEVRLGESAAGFLDQFRRLPETIEPQHAVGDVVCLATRRIATEHTELRRANPLIWSLPASGSLASGTDTKR